jgi:peptidoglycan/LPS O-acetylase OafA/YrhL
VTSFEYVLLLVSILIGLAVAVLVVSLHRLLRARRRVAWHWLPLAAALLVLMLILQFWWAFYEMGHAAAWTSYGGFLILAATLVSMFLLASGALPDAIPDEGLDLCAYYDENRRYFWLLFALFTVMALVVDYVSGTDVKVESGPLHALPTLAIAALLASLAFVRRRGYHAVVVLLLLVFFGWQWSQLRIG